MTFNKTGKVTGVKGFTYEIPVSGNSSVFSASVKENANVWFRRYSNAAAFDASEQEYGSAASFAGQDTPTITPGSGSSDSQSGEMFSVSQVPDGTSVFETSLKNPDGYMGQTWDGKYFYLSNRNQDFIYKTDENFNNVGSIPAPGPNTAGLTWDGSYIWAADLDASTIYQIDDSGTEISSFAANSGRSRGVAWDGSYLWEIAESAATMYKVKTNGTVTQTFSLSANQPHTNTFDGEYIWVNDNGSFSIYQYDRSGSEVSSFSAPTQSGPEGITWNGEYLYNTSFFAKVYRIQSSNSLDLSYQIGGIS